MESGEEVGEILQGSPKQAPADAEQGGGVVGHGLRRTRENEEVYFRRSRRVRFTLFEDVQPDPGDHSAIIRSIRFLRVS